MTDYDAHISSRLIQVHNKDLRVYTMIIDSKVVDKINMDHFFDGRNYEIISITGYKPTHSDPIKFLKFIDRAHGALSYLNGKIVIKL